MELLYGWIKDFKPFKDFPFSLSNKYFFVFDEQKQKLLFTVNKEALPEDFFSKNIVSVNPILGENGAGKTRFFNYISSFFANPSIKCILIIRHRGSITIFHHHDVKFELEVVNIDELSDKEKKISQKISIEIISENNNWLLELMSKNVTKIYINHNLQPSSFFPSPNFEDRSTTTLFRSTVDKNISAPGEYSQYILQEFNENLKLISRRPKLINELFHVPTKTLGLYFDSSLSISQGSNRISGFLRSSRAIQRLLNSKKRIPLGANYYIYKDLELQSALVGLGLIQFLEIYSFELPVGISIEELNRNIQFELTNHVGDIPTEENYPLQLWKFFRSKANAKSIELQLQNPVHDDSYYGPDLALVQFEMKFTIVPKFFKLYLKVISQASEIKIKSLPKTRQSEIRRGSRRNPFTTKPLMGFNWHISTGQISYLSILSRIVRGKSKFKGNSIWLILDEVDQVFHPKWEISFLPTLAKFLELEFPKYKVQVFFGSHNPLILSDVPHTNAVLIKSINGASENVTKVYPVKTFGGNVHSLYSKSFLLEDGFIGKFSQGKIDDVVKYLNLKIEKKDIPLSIKMDQDTALNIIHLIGEPVVRLVLLDLFNKAFPSESTIEKLRAQRKKIDEEITALQSPS